ncbi:MAG TPA: hypothetical protein VMC85_24115 [Desulfomonilaceae bacterium]|nr:hypothetical protein [Desulfomonilaceae bacterium]
MSRPKMRCPFSKQLCRECPIFRGRHLNLCSVAKNAGGSRGPSKTTGSRLGSKDDEFEQWKLLEPPVMPKNPKWLADIEDCIE